MTDIKGIDIMWQIADKLIWGESRFTQKLKGGEEEQIPTLG